MGDCGWQGSGIPESLAERGFPDKTGVLLKNKGVDYGQSKGNRPSRSQHSALERLTSCPLQHQAVLRACLCPHPAGYGSWFEP